MIQMWLVWSCENIHKFQDLEENVKIVENKLEGNYFLQHHVLQTNLENVGL